MVLYLVSFFIRAFRWKLMLSEYKVSMQNALNAIVVGFATMSVGLALIYQIHKEYGTILESEIDAINEGKE